ncbi:hypothetical protein G6F35_018021 [Rhizopus arrhizus]|nr:hypothetical protein G6F35_018021 [Rhizopus arrhizus]
MFTPRAFAETDLLWLDRLLARDPFVTVLTTGSDGLPELTRMPVLYRRDVTPSWRGQGAGRWPTWLHLGQLVPGQGARCAGANLELRCGGTARPAAYL